MDIKEVSCVSTDRLSRHPWESARLEVICKLLEKSGPWIKDRNEVKTILDIGCGDAFVIRELAIRHPKTRFIGIDQAFGLANIKDFSLDDSIHNVELHQSFDQISSQKACVDAVLFLDVLEHVKDDRSFLKSVLSHKLIKKNAIIVVTVPAFQTLFCSRDLFLGHIRRYNCKRILEAVNEGQMAIVEYGYFFTCLLLPRLLQVLFEELSIIRPRAGTSLSAWRGLGFLDLFVKSMLLFDFELSQCARKLGVLFPGLSLYLIGRKQELSRAT